MASNSKNTSNKKFLTKSPEETLDLGRRLGKRLKASDVVCLSGDLGGGKTLFTKGIAESLDIKDTIISPTFVISRKYEREQYPTLYHLDLYRISTPSELEGIDLEDIIKDKNSITVIEWPENASSLIPNTAIWILFKYIRLYQREIEIRGINLI